MDKINRFKECREKTPYTQKQVAMIIGVKPPQLSKWERGEGISRKNCIQLAKLYNVSADYLLGLSDDPSPSNAPQAQKDPATLGGVSDSVMRLFDDLRTADLTDAEADYIRAQIAGVKALRAQE
jgi:transcriptional regulator with XRE-family HTH domain